MSIISSRVIMSERTRITSEIPEVHRIEAGQTHGASGRMRRLGTLSAKRSTLDSERGTRGARAVVFWVVGLHVGLVGAPPLFVLRSVFCVMRYASYLRQTLTKFFHCFFARSWCLFHQAFYACNTKQCGSFIRVYAPVNTRVGVCLSALPAPACSG